MPALHPSWSLVLRVDCGANAAKYLWFKGQRGDPAHARAAPRRLYSCSHGHSCFTDLCRVHCTKLSGERVHLPALGVLKFALSAGVRPIGAACSNDTESRHRLFQCSGCSAVGGSHAARFRLLMQLFYPLHLCIYAFS